jgi:hypothetical protein
MHSKDALRLLTVRSPARPTGPLEGVRLAAPGPIHLLRQRRVSTIPPALLASPCGLLFPFTASLRLCPQSSSDMWARQG